MRSLILGLSILLMLSSCLEREYRIIELGCIGNSGNEIIEFQNSRGEIYEFSLKLPLRYDYCGKQPIYLCQINNLDKFFAIDTNLIEKITLIVVTDPIIQNEYDSMFPSNEEEIKKVISESNNSTNQLNEEFYIKTLGLLDYEKLELTLCNIDNTQFVGSGYLGYLKGGYAHSEYSIYGYKNEILIGLRYETMENLDPNTIDELYCILNDLTINWK